MSTFMDAARELDELKRRVERLESLVQTLSQQKDSPPRIAYRPSEVAKMIGKSTATIRVMIRDGRLDAEDMGGWYAVPAEAVDTLLDTGRRSEKGASAARST